MRRYRGVMPLHTTQGWPGPGCSRTAGRWPPGRRGVPPTRRKRIPPVSAARGDPVCGRPPGEGNRPQPREAQVRKWRYLAGSGHREKMRFSPPAPGVGCLRTIGRALGESPTGGDLLDAQHGLRVSSPGPYFFRRGNVKREYLSGGPGRAAVSQLLFSGRNSRERCIAPVP